MACPRCQIETHGTRLCNHCYKTRSKSNPLVASQLTEDRPLSWQVLRKNNPAHRGFQSTTGIQTIRSGSSRPEMDNEFSNSTKRLTESDHRMPGTGNLWISGNRWVGLGLMIFVFGQLVSIGAFMAGSFSVWCTGNMLSVIGVAFTMFSACNTIGLPGRHLARLPASPVNLTRRSSTAPRLPESS
ncbi:MAG: hypothetical protein MK108_09855 [Mariniblastus sp.]|nr:hypothetical protein [Mariniblastus sp.]